MGDCCINCCLILDIMLNAKKLWSVEVTLAPQHADAFAAAFYGALAVSVFAPPRREKARIEALYSEPPDRAGLVSRLAVIAAAAA